MSEHIGHGRLVAIAAAALLALALLPGSAGANGVYWTSGSDVWGANADGSAAVSVFGGQNLPMGVAVDAADGRLYWTDFLSDQILVGTIEGSNGTVLFGGEPTPLGLAIDPEGGKLYWSAGGDIRAGNLDGSGATTLYSGEGATRGIAIDPEGGKIYWARTFAGGPIRVGNLDGSGLATTLYGGENGPSGVAVDPAADRIYWVNDVGTVRVAPLDGSGSATTVYSGQGFMRGLALDPAAGRLYWTDLFLSALRVGDVDGSGLVSTLVSTASPNFLALLRAPAGTAAPAVAGDGELGEPLSCDDGAWAPDLPGASLSRAPADLARQWLRDGADVPGATSSTFTPDTPGAYSCRVTATNHGGSTAQTSAPVTVAAPTPSEPPAPPAPTPDPPVPGPGPQPQPQPQPTDSAAATTPSIERLALAPRCVRRSAAGRVRVRMRLRMTAAAPVQVRIERGAGTGPLDRCPRPSRARHFDGGYRPAETLRRLATRPLGLATAAAASVERELAFSARLTPGLYRVTVRAHGDEDRLSRPARRYLRVLG